jgi:glycosyltransferase involved in cell wall biosynthesis
MRLLINALATKTGGAREVARQMIESLEAADTQRSVEATVLHTWPPEDLPSATRFSFVRLHLRRPLSRVLYEQLVMPFTARSFNVVLSLGNVGPLLSPSPSIVFLHNLAPLCPVAWPSPTLQRARRLALRAAMTWSCRRAALVLTPYKWMVADPAVRALVGRAHLDTLLTGWEVKGPGLSPDEAAKHAKQRWSVKPPFLLVVADLYPHKNLLALVDGYAAARQAREMPQLVVAGGSYLSGYTAALEARIEDAQLHDQVRLIGRVDRLELPALYGAACGLIAPSLCEVGSLPITEAIHYGVPVLASDIQAHRELIGEGFLFDAQDRAATAMALARLASGDVATARLTETRSWVETGRNLLQVLFRVGATGGGSN